MKKSVLFLIIGFAIIICGINIILKITYGNDPLAAVLNRNNFSATAEQSEVDSIFYSHFPQAKKYIQNVPSSLEEKYRKNHLASIPTKMGTPYKVYIIIGDFSKRYQSEPNLDNLFAEFYLWEVPLIDNQNNIVSSSFAWKNNGKWEIGGTGLNIPSDLMQFSASPETIRQFLVNNDLTKIQDLKHIRILSALMDALYITKDSGEKFLVPLTHRPDLVGLENLRVYALDYAMKVLNERFPPMEINKDGFINTK